VKIRFILLVLTVCIFLQGYKYEYKIEALDASKNANNHNAQGIMWMEMSQYAPALSEFQMAIALSPNTPASAAYYNNMGLIYVKVNNFTAAHACFEKAIELNPVFLEYYNKLVLMYKKSGRLDSELNKQLEKIKTDKNNSSAYFMAGLIYREKGNKSDAIKYLKEFITLEKDIILSRAAKQMIYEMKTQ